MNSLTAYALGQLLNTRLKNCVIEGICQYPNLVTISLSGGWYSYLHIFHSGFEPELVPSNSLIANMKYSIPIFKQAANNKIIGVKTLGTDRIILITIRSSGNWIGNKDYILRLDLIPSNSPLTLFNEETGGVVSTVSSLRSMAPTSPYDTPPTHPFSLLSLPNEKPPGLFRDQEEPREGPEKHRNLASKLFNSINGLDPLLARAIVSESNGNPDSIWNLTRKTGERLKKNQFKWHVYRLSESDNIKTAIYPLSLPVGSEITRTESYPEAMKLHTELSIFSLFIHELKQRASKTKRKELKHLNSLCGNLSKDLNKARRYEEFSLYGNLLSTHYDRLKKGMGEITLPSFSGKEKITIQLDKALGPHQNIQLYFKKAKKGKKGLKKITNRFKSAEKRLAQVSNSLEKLLGLTSPDELLKLIPPQRDSSSYRSEKSPEGFRKFILDKHHTVYIGRNARENDLLTHKFASRQDLWFHAKGVPGSHVILKGANSSTPPDILETTASIAAYYSKSRHSKIVPVTYTEKKFVSKPRKSPPGTAAIQRENVLFVNPSIPSSD